MKAREPRKTNKLGRGKQIGRIKYKVFMEFHFVE